MTSDDPLGVDVRVPSRVLGPLLIYGGPDRAEYPIGIEILLERDRQEALNVLSWLYADFPPETVRHIVIQMRVDPDEVVDELACVDCGVNVVFLDEQAYMTRDDVWSAAGSAAGYLCIGCLEYRLGRTLTADDFEDVRFTTSPDWPRSERLASRIEGRSDA